MARECLMTTVSMRHPSSARLKRVLKPNRADKDVTALAQSGDLPFKLSCLFYNDTSLLGPETGLVFSLGNCGEDKDEIDLGLRRSNHGCGIK